MTPGGQPLSSIKLSVPNRELTAACVSLESSRYGDPHRGDAAPRYLGLHGRQV
jgi:hypothetical protein